MTENFTENLHIQKKLIQKRSQKKIQQTRSEKRIQFK